MFLNVFYFFCFFNVLFVFLFFFKQIKKDINMNILLLVVFVESLFSLFIFVYMFGFEKKNMEKKTRFCKTWLNLNINFVFLFCLIWMYSVDIVFFVLCPNFNFYFSKQSRQMYNSRSKLCRFEFVSLANKADCIRTIQHSYIVS